jgi:hypothetical protein
VVSRSLPPGGVGSVGLAAGGRTGVHAGVKETRAKQGRWRLAGLAALAALALAAARADLAINAPSGMPIGKVVTAQELWREFNRTMPAGAWVSPLENLEYQVISARWLRRCFLPALKDQMKAIREQKLPEEDSAANCNGLALVCRLMLGLSAMESHARAPATATVIVKQENPFGGLSATMENHCVAFVLTDEGPWIIEAQSGAYAKIRDYPNLSSIKLVSVH